MRRADVLISGLAVCAIGVAMWVGFEAVHISLWWGASISVVGLGIALSYLWAKEPAAQPSDDAIARQRAALRLREIAQSALDMANGADNDGNFRTGFFRRWNPSEFASLHNHLQIRFGVGVREDWLTRGPHLGQLEGYVAALREAADQLDAA